MSEKHNLSELLLSLFSLDAILPGTITQQARNCGNPKCRCMRKENPEKHPYFQLSYSIEGENSTVYLKNAEIDAAREMSDSYKNLRQTVNRLSLAVIDLLREHGILKGRDILIAEIEKQRCKAAGIKSRPLPSAKAKVVIDNWKSKCLARQVQIEKHKIKIRDTTNSRNKWRKEALQLRKKNQELEKQLPAKATENKTSSVESLEPIKKNQSG